MEDLLAMLFVFIVVVIPVFGFTARFAISPLLQTLLKLREASAKQSAESETRLAELTVELQRLADAVDRLEEGSTFERELRKSALPGVHPHA